MNMESAVEAAKKVFPKAQVESDSRQSYLTNWFCSEIYVKKYGVQYPWQAKEAKLLQTVLRWADKNFDPAESVYEIQKGIEKYLYDERPYYAKDKHPFSLFAHRVTVWMTKEEKGRKVMPRTPEPESKRLNLEEFKVECEKHILSNPEKFARGFVKTGKLLSKINPEGYQWARAYLFELLGPERSKRIVGEVATANTL